MNSCRIEIQATSEYPSQIHTYKRKLEREQCAEAKRLGCNDISDLTSLGACQPFVVLETARRADLSGA